MNLGISDLLSCIVFLKSKVLQSNKGVNFFNTTLKTRS